MSLIFCTLIFNNFSYEDHYQPLNTIMLIYQSWSVYLPPMCVSDILVLSMSSVCVSVLYCLSPAEVFEGRGVIVRLFGHLFVHPYVRLSHFLWTQLLQFWGERPETWGIVRTSSGDVHIVRMFLSYKFPQSYAPLTFRGLTSTLETLNNLVDATLSPVLGRVTWNLGNSKDIKWRCSYCQNVFINRWKDFILIWH